MKILMMLFAVLSMSAFNTADAPKAESVPGGAYLKINGKFGGDIAQSELAKSFSLEIDGCAAGAKIYQYTLVLKRSGKTIKHTGDSNDLTKDMLADLRSLEKGDSFTFERVKARLGKEDRFDVVARTFYVA